MDDQQALDPYILSILIMKLLDQTELGESVHIHGYSEEFLRCKRPALEGKDYMCWRCGESDVRDNTGGHIVMRFPGCPSFHLFFACEECKDYPFDLERPAPDIPRATFTRAKK